MYKEDEYLQLSGIQHFAFCRRQWALIHIEKLWSENDLTASGRIIHERVHDSAKTESRGDELTVRGMPIKSDALGISGECDAVVFTKSNDGVKLRGRDGLWNIMPVEYKHGSAKANDCDRLQAAAQAICLEEMFCAAISRAALYYHETRSREYIDLTSELREQVKKYLSEMHDMFRRGYTPRVREGAQCRRCSLRDMCIPETGRKGTVSEYIRKHTGEKE